MQQITEMFDTYVQKKLTRRVRDASFSSQTVPVVPVMIDRFLVLLFSFHFLQGRGEVGEVICFSQKLDLG